MMPLPAEPAPRAALRSALALPSWIAAGPTASMVALLGGYWATGEKCTGVSKVSLFALLLTAALVTIAASCACLRALRGDARAGPERAARTAARVRFLAAAGLALNAFACVLVLAMAVPIVWLVPCE